MPPPWPVPRRTADLPPVGGRLLPDPEDFVVEEIPAYPASGTGDHVFLWVEKRGLPAAALVAQVAAAAGISPTEVGAAGMKDTVAVTRQFLSVPAAAAAAFGEPGAAAPAGGWSVLSQARHPHKLRTGHLRGNRFRVVLRGVHADGVARADATLTRLEDLGMPNFYGPQRFGRGGATVAAGRALLAGRGAAAARGPGRRFALSALQSALFNALLADRVAGERLGQVEAGEVLQVVASGGPFVCDDVVACQRRYLAREVVPAGPMLGPRMRAAQGVPAAREAAFAAALGLDEAALRRHGGRLARGTRRPYVVWPKDVAVAAADAGTLTLSFTLPAGSYATVLLHELGSGIGAAGPPV